MAECSTSGSRAASKPSVERFSKASVQGCSSTLPATFLVIAVFFVMVVSLVVDGFCRVCDQPISARKLSMAVAVAAGCSRCSQWPALEMDAILARPKRGKMVVVTSSRVVSGLGERQRYLSSFSHCARLLVRSLGGYKCCKSGSVTAGSDPWRAAQRKRLPFQLMRCPRRGRPRRIVPISQRRRGMILPFN
jgi:hypothetical protein